MADSTTAYGTTAGWPQRLRGVLARHRFWVIVATITAGALALIGVASGLGSSRDALGANNPAPNGARAVVEILRRQGVNVAPTDSLAGTLAALHREPVSTVLVYDPTSILAPGQLAQLVRTGALLVLVEPRPTALAGVDPQLRASGVGPGTHATQPAACSDPAATAAGSIETGSGASAGTLYRGPVTCFASPPSGGGSYATNQTGTVRLLGNPAVLSNDRLSASGNAALALNSLGSRAHLIWYLPTLADLAPQDRSQDLSQLTPSWVVPAASWLVFVALLAMLAKGRRDGPLVLEPLVVSVKASETAAGRARLYQESRATDRAAANLRAAALQRLASHFRLGRTAEADDVAAAVATATGRPLLDVVLLLLTFRPSTEAALLSWANDVAELEKEATGQ